MIPYIFSYLRPDSLLEAKDINLNNKKENMFFYAGGSEIITMSRVGSIKPEVVVDLKNIPECSLINLSEDKLIIGSCVALSKIKEKDYFPLLTKAVGRIADHTNQTRITIGGNVCGTIIYRESVLPLLLTDCTVIICGVNQNRSIKINDIFDKRIKLGRGEFIIQFIIDKHYLKLPYVHVKNTKNEKIDYPVLTLAAILLNGQIRMAFSGLLSYPFRSIKIEAILNDISLTPEKRAENAASALPEAPLSDIDASSEYRLFVFKNTVIKAIKKLEESGE